MQTPPSDSDWLDVAARLAARGRPVSRPNPAIGCVIVRDGIVIGRGWTQAGGRPHAEAMALEQAGPATEGAIVYVTLEPCAHMSERGPACADLLVAAKPARVVIGAGDPDPRTAGAGIARLNSAGIATTLVETEAAARSLAGYMALSAFDRPHITLKLAMSLDGCIALANGESQWITGEVARTHVHSRRAMSDAILVGGGTWRADKPQLDVRLPGLEDRSPMRIVLTRGVIPAGVKVVNTPEQVTRFDGIQYLYLEGGAGAAVAFLARDLVDRIDLYRAPILIGGGQPTLQDFGLESLARAHNRWALVERRQLGSDSYEAYERQR